MPHVVIVGAGPSGLAVAFRIRRADPAVRLTILEPRDRPGGNVRTEDRDGYRIEHGPNGFLDSKPGTLDLCRDLGLGDRLIPASEGSRKNRYVFVRERLRKLPGSPEAILTTPLLTLAGKLALLREPFRPRPSRVPDDESVAAFARRRFGREAADIFVDALVTGIHAADPETLSVKAAFPRLVQFEADHGSVLRGFLAAAKRKKRDALARGEPKPPPARMWSFAGGLQVMIDALREKIGTPITHGVRVTRIAVNPTGPRWSVFAEGREPWHADAVVLTCPAHEQAPILADLDPILSREIAGIPFNRIVVAALGYRQSDVPGGPLDGFGYIAPQHTRRDVLGVQWCSSIFPDRAPPGMVLWRALCGGAGRDDVFDWDDDTLIRAVHRELRIAMVVRDLPAFARIVRWPKAIPQYVIGHPARVARIETAAARHRGLFLTGNSYHGIALNDVAEQAAAVARRVVEQYHGR